MSSLASKPRSRRDAAVAFAVYVAVLTAAYYYSLTFVQLGVTGFGIERLGLSPDLVAVAMGVLAVTTLAATLVSGRLLDRVGSLRSVRSKFRVLFGIVLLQLAVTDAVTAVASFAGFLAWILVCSVLLGTAIPFTFSLLSDLVAPEKRGYAAGTVAGVAFFLAALFPFRWTIEGFVPAAIAVLAPVAVLLGVLSIPAVRTERFTHVARRNDDEETRPGMLSAAFLGGILLLFGAFFVDSLGFVRIVEAPQYVDASWQSSDIGTRMLIASTHVVGGIAAGVVYTKTRYVWLFFATFVLFAAAQFLYVYDIVLGGPAVLATLLPLVYVLAVSCYTTVAFALWPDLATPETVGTYTAVGIGIGGWLATFTSTAVALVSERLRLPLELHLLVVVVASVGFLFVTVLLLYGRERLDPRTHTPTRIER